MQGPFIMVESIIKMVRLFEHCCKEPKFSRVRTRYQGYKTFHAHLEHKILFKNVAPFHQGITQFVKVKCNDLFKFNLTP